MRRVEIRNMVQKPFTTSRCSKHTHLGARPPKPLAFLSLVMSVAAGVTHDSRSRPAFPPLPLRPAMIAPLSYPKDGVQRPILKWNLLSLLRHNPHKTHKNLNKTKTTSFLDCKLVCWPRVTFAFFEGSNSHPSPLPVLAVSCSCDLSGSS